jgi:hypothetical protein
MRGNIHCLLLGTSRLDRHGDGGRVAGAGELAGCRHIYILSYQTGKPCAGPSASLRPCVGTIRNQTLKPRPPPFPLMLRLGLFAYTRPLFRPVAPRSGLKVFSLRSFGSVEARPRILEVLRNRPPNVVTRPFQQSSRGIVDSAVISRPSQTEAWRRYAVTAVCCIARAEPTTYTFVGHGRRHYHWRRGVFEQGHAR